jgi:hypothetical protein
MECLIDFHVILLRGGVHLGHNALGAWLKPKTGIYRLANGPASIAVARV